MYHALVVLLCIVSSVSITGMPSPYNSSTQMMNSASFLAFIVPTIKLLIELKYRSEELDFYGVFYDYFATIVRIMLPITIVGYASKISSILSFLIYFDTNKPLPKWLFYTIILLSCLTMVFIIRSFTPSKPEEPTELEEYKNLGKDSIDEWDKAEQDTQALLQ